MDRRRYLVIGVGLVVVAVVLTLVLVRTSEASGSTAGGNCAGLSGERGVVVDVMRVWPGWEMTIDVNGRQDRLRTLRRVTVGQSVDVWGMVCFGQLDVMRWIRK